MNTRSRYLMLMVLLVVMFLTAVGASAISNETSVVHPSTYRLMGDIELVSQLGGEARAPIVVQGNYAYAGQGSRLVILDVTDPAKPSLVGQTQPLPDFVDEVAISGDYAYVVNGLSGLRVFDISDVVNPVQVGGFDIPGWHHVLHVSVVGNYAFLPCTDKRLRIFDISDPTSLTKIGQHVFTVEIGAIAINSDHAFIGSQSGLHVLDVSNPTNPIQVSLINTPSELKKIVVAGNHLYLAGGGLHIYDVANPASLTKESSFSISGFTVGLDVKDEYAYIIKSGGQLIIVDVSDPKSPSKAGSFNAAISMSTDVRVEGDLAYLNNAPTGLLIVNVEQPQAAVEVGHYKTLGHAGDLAVANRHAYVTADLGLNIIDVNNPAHPEVTGLFKSSGEAARVAVVGDYAYLTDGNYLRVIDVSTPSSPIEIGRTSCSGGAPTVEGQYAYVSEWGSGLHIVDISDPANPQEVGLYQASTPNRVAIQGKYAYLAHGREGLYIIDIGDPGSPTRIGHHDTPDWAIAVAVSGNYAYVADRYAGLRIIDAGNPAQPKEVGFYDTPGQTHGIAVFGDFVYLADGLEGVRVVYVGNPAEPVEIASHNTPGFAGPISVLWDHIYVAEGVGGFTTLRFTQPPTPTATPGPSPTPTATPANPWAVWREGGDVLIPPIGVDLAMDYGSLAASSMMTCELNGPVLFDNGLAVMTGTMNIAGTFYFPLYQAPGALPEQPFTLDVMLADIALQRQGVIAYPHYMPLLAK